MVTLVFHDVCSACGTYAIRSATLTSFLDWLASRNGAGTVVQPVGDVIGGGCEACR